MATDRTAERRALYESILSDPAASHADRLRADERLAELEAIEAARAPQVDDELSVEQIWAEIDSFHAMTLTAMYVRSGPELQLDPKQFPETTQALRTIVGQLVEATLFEDERERESRRREQQPTPPEDDSIEADAVDVPEPRDEALPSPKPVKQLPPGIDLNAGWPRPPGPGFAQPGRND